MLDESTHAAEVAEGLSSEDYYKQLDDLNN
jgi:hypothetical protein